MLTGQHPKLRAEDHGLAGFPRVELGCAGTGDPYLHVGLVARAIGQALDSCALAVVQGDTSSALGGALGAAMAGVPVAHVEAGLRSHDRLNPWPEEDFRIAIDRQATLLFAPTGLSAANLRREGAPGSVLVTGNTGVDALLDRLPLVDRRGAAPDGSRRILVTCHRRESWGEGFQGIAAAIREIAGRPGVEIRFVLHPNARVAATMRAHLGSVSNIHLLEACSHVEMLSLMRGSDLILSDSGGIQEEAPALGTPLLVLRAKTERPEGIATGNARLVGTATDRIVEEVRHLLDDPLALAAMSRRALPYGDGQAAPRIAAVVEDWLERRRVLPPVSSRRPRRLGNW